MLLRARGVDGDEAKFSERGTTGWPVTSATISASAPSGCCDLSSEGSRAGCPAHDAQQHAGRSQHRCVIPHAAAQPHRQVDTVRTNGWRSWSMSGSGVGLSLHGTSRLEPAAAWRWRDRVSRHSASEPAHRSASTAAPSLDRPCALARACGSRPPAPCPLSSSSGSAAACRLHAQRAPCVATLASASWAQVHQRQPAPVSLAGCLSSSGGKTSSRPLRGRAGELRAEQVAFGQFRFGGERRPPGLSARGRSAAALAALQIAHARARRGHRHCRRHEHLLCRSGVMVRRLRARFQIDQRVIGLAVAAARRVKAQRPRLSVTRRRC